MPPQAEASLALEYNTDTRKLREERDGHATQICILPLKGQNGKRTVSGVVHQPQKLSQAIRMGGKAAPLFQHPAWHSRAPEIAEAGLKRK